MKRNGNKLNTIPDGHPRRMADGKNAWRKMNEEQREEFVCWMLHGSDFGGRSLLAFFPAELVGSSLRAEHYFAGITDAVELKRKGAK